MAALVSELVVSSKEFKALIDAGIRNSEFSFTESIILSWLDSYPNDLFCELQLARVNFHQNKRNEAIKRVTQVLVRDPEYLDAYMLLAEIGGKIDTKAVKSFIFLLGGTTEVIEEIYPWAVTLRAVRMGIRRKELENSGKMLASLLKTNSDNPLVAFAHAQYMIVEENPMVIHVLQKYHKKWTECLQFTILFADVKMKTGDEAEAIGLIHKCVSQDPTGQVVKRILSPNHPFNSHWEQAQSLKLNMPIPSGVAVALNWNQLNAGEKYYSYGRQNKLVNKTIGREKNEKSSEEIKRAQTKTQNFPVYVILTTKNGLENKYGNKTAKIILEELEGLSEVVNRKHNWEALVFTPDNLNLSLRGEIETISSIDPWKIKLSLNDLDKYLKKQSRMIGAVLIVGGHGVIPFHKLPNPTDDSDDGVLSDNPYSTSSSNYLIPEWPTGRLPEEKGPDPGLLLEQIRQITDFHQNSLKKRSIFSRLVTTLLDRTEIRKFLRDIFSPPRNFGYSAAVWRRASLSVFRPIGSGASLRITPPYTSETIDVENLMNSKCAYFNLHGLSSTPEWYGQRDFSEKPTGPDFPVAITTNEIKKLKNNVDLTLSEACYGGYVMNKKIDESIALKLISIGIQGLVGSTCIAYGSVFPPLIGADLLARIFWKYIKDGYSFGESLMQAKIGLVKVMSQRQGYLDGEDQKTLESFVLYGDPLGCLEENIYLEKKIPATELGYQQLDTFSDQDGFIASSPRISKQLIKEINNIVQCYIPNLDDAEIKIREHQIRLEKILNHKSEKQRSEPLLKSRVMQKRTQVTYSQKFKAARITHEQFARVTLDDSGNVIKLTVSR